MTRTLSTESLAGKMMSLEQIVSIKSSCEGSCLQSFFELASRTDDTTQGGLRNLARRVVTGNVEFTEQAVYDVLKEETGDAKRTDN